VFPFVFLQYPDLEPEMQIKWEKYEEYVDDIVSEGLFNAIACRSVKFQGTINFIV
jgi:hypothetical protein